MEDSFILGVCGKLERDLGPRGAVLGKELRFLLPQGGGHDGCGLCGQAPARRPAGSGFLPWEAERFPVERNRNPGRICQQCIDDLRDAWIDTGAGAGHEHLVPAPIGPPIEMVLAEVSRVLATDPQRDAFVEEVEDALRRSGTCMRCGRFPARAPGDRGVLSCRHCFAIDEFRGVWTAAHRGTPLRDVAVFEIRAWLDRWEVGVFRVVGRRHGRHGPELGYFYEPLRNVTFGETGEILVWVDRPLVDRGAPLRFRVLAASQVTAVQARPVARDADGWMEVEIAPQEGTYRIEVAGPEGRTLRTEVRCAGPPDPSFEDTTEAGSGRAVDLVSEFLDCARRDPRLGYERLARAYRARVDFGRFREALGTAPDGGGRSIGGSVSGRFLSRLWVEQPPHRDMSVWVGRSPDGVFEIVSISGAGPELGREEG